MAKYSGKSGQIFWNGDVVSLSEWALNAMDDSEHQPESTLAMTDGPRCLTGTLSGWWDDSLYNAPPGLRQLIVDMDLGVYFTKDEIIELLYGGRVEIPAEEIERRREVVNEIGLQASDFVRAEYDLK